MLNAFIPFLAFLNSVKLNRNCLLIVFSESLNYGHDFLLQLFVFFVVLFFFASHKIDLSRFCGAGF